MGQPPIGGSANELFRVADFAWPRRRTASRLEWRSSARGSGYEDASIQGSAKRKAAGQAGHRRTGVWSSAWPSASYEKGAHSTEGDADKEDGNIVKDTSAAETGPRQASGSW